MFPFPVLLALIDDQKKLYADFEKEAIPHIDALYNFALRMTGNCNEADDLVQETYLKAFGFFDKFERGSSCRDWLFRIMKNTFMNSYRKVSKEHSKIDYEKVENFYDKIKPSLRDSAHLEKEINDNLPDDELSNVIASLPEDFRTVIILCDIEGFTYEEIADFVDIPEGTVRSRLHRARKMLFTRLYEYAAHKGYVEQTTGAIR